MNVDDGQTVQSVLLPTLEIWINEISFYVANEPNASPQRLAAWANLEHMLSTLEPSIMQLVIVKQQHLVDIVMQHIPVASYGANREVWQRASICLTNCMKGAKQLMWGATDWSPAEVFSSMMDVCEKAMLESASDSSAFKYALQAVQVSASLFLGHPCSDDTYALFLGHISELLLRLEDNSIYRRKLASVLQSFLFSLAAMARDALLSLHDQPTTDVPAADERAMLPLGGSVQLLQTLCEHKSIVKHPLLVRAILRSHAALCSIPIDVAPTQSTSLARSTMEALQRGWVAQNSIICNFCRHLQLCIADKSLQLAAPSTVRQDLVVDCCPLVCVADTPLRDAARRLMHILVTDRTDLLDENGGAQAALSMRQVCSDAKSLGFGLSLLNGIGKLLMDLGSTALLDGGDESVAICAGVDEVLELLLEYLVTRMVAYTIDEALATFTLKVSEVLQSCSGVPRPKLSPALVLMLQKGANCNIRACAQLLEANVRFVTPKHAPTPASVPASVKSSKPPVVQSNPAREVVDLSGLDRYKASSSAEPAQKQSADAWAFLKPTKAAAPPMPPLSRLDNSISRASAAAVKPAGRETVLDRMEREEKEQQALERRNLIRKRMFGDIDSNPPPNSEDLMGKVGKLAKYNSEFSGNVSWLAAKSLPKEESSWEQQIRELKEAKALARALAESKKPAEATRQDQVPAIQPLRRERSSGSDKSALLEVNDAQDEDEGDSGASSRRKVTDWRELLSLSSGPNKTGASASMQSKGSTSAAESDITSLMQTYLNGQREAAASGRAGGKAQPSFAEAMSAISIDPLIRKLLRCNLSELCATGTRGRDGVQKAAFEQVPIRFLEEEHYIQSFSPLLLDEVTTALVAFVLGENTSDEARGSGVATGSTYGGGGGGGGSSSSSSPLRVRCLLTNARAGQPKLQEAHVVQDDFPRGKLVKDDLVMVFPTAAHSDTDSLQELVRRPHSLALVMTSPPHGRDFRNNRAGEKKQAQQTLLVLAGNVLPMDKVRLVVPIMSLTSFLREWSAVMSIRNHRLMPLAPYLLKASPVVSSQHLSMLHDAITNKLRALECNTEFAMSAERQTKLNAALLEDLQQICAVQVDGSVLKNTGIAKTMKKVSAATSKWIARQCEDLAVSILSKWKEQIKNDNRGSTIKSMKGGKLIEMPAEGSIERPRCVSPELWSTFQASYNISQLFAIKYVSDQFEGGQDTRIALVQGPPGTGKTSTVLGMASALLNHDYESAAQSGRNRLLICAPSNTAVDELLGRLSTGVLDSTGQRRAVRIVRLGDPLEGASQMIVQLSLDTQIEARLQKEEAWTRLNSAQEQIAALDKTLSTLPNVSTVVYGSGASAPALSKEQQRVRTLRTELATQRQVKVAAEMALERARLFHREQILLEADIVGATLSGSGRKQFLDLALQKDLTFDTAIIDEAAQATEPSCLIPLRLGCRRLVLVGDPRQLPATVLSRSAGQAGLGRSLFERLERADHEVVMLTIQYRMHPAIRSFPSKFFYQNLLTDAAEAQALAPISVSGPNGALRTFSPVRFVDLRVGGESPAGKSYVNDTEVTVITRLLSALLPRLDNHSISIITPYKAQVNKLKRALREDRHLSALQYARKRQDGEVEVNSVDGFQGREKDVIIFSAVRSNPRHQGDAMQESADASGRSAYSIGFVADERRLNVAITRAKRLLILVGNAGTLSADGTWRAMYQNLSERGMVKRLAHVSDLGSEGCVFDFLT